MEEAWKIVCWKPLMCAKSPVFDYRHSRRLAVQDGGFLHNENCALDVDLLKPMTVRKISMKQRIW